MKLGSKLWIGGTVTLAAGGAIFFALLQDADLPQSARQLDRERELAKFAGMPLTSAQLRAELAVPDSENAAPIYRKIEAMMRRGNFMRSVWDAERDLEKPISNPAGVAAARDFIAKSKPILDLAKSAVAKPFLNFDHDWAAGPKLKFEDVFYLQDLKQLLSLKANLAVHDGDIDGAEVCWLGLAKLADQIVREPALTDALEAQGCQIAILKSIDLALRTQWNKPGFLDRVEKVINRVGPTPDFGQALTGDFVILQENIKLLQTRGPHALDGGFDGVDYDDDWGAPKAYYLDPLLRSATAYDAYRARVFEAFRKSREALAHSDPLDKYAGLLAVSEDLKKHKDQSYMLAKIAYTDEDVNYLGILASEAFRRLEICKIGLLRERLRTGKFPGRLSTDAIDPFSGKPFRYRLVPGGFVLWSIGTNLKDDGGVVERVGWHIRTPDIVVSFKE